MPDEAHFAKCCIYMRYNSDISVYLANQDIYFPAFPEQQLGIYSYFLKYPIVLRILS